MNRTLLLLTVCLVCLFHAVCFAAAYEPGQVGPPAKGERPVSDNSGEFKVSEADVFLFSGAQGPQARTPLLALRPANWEDYRQPGGGRLGILLTEEKSAWLALAHGLRSFGIPFTITKDWKEVLQQPVVMVYPSISGQNLPQEALQALAAFPRQGGTLIGIQVLGGGLNEIFGFREATASRQYHSVELLTGQTDLFQGLDDPRERKLSISQHGTGAGEMGTVSYQVDFRHPPLAVYEDGSAMLLRKSYGKGKTYAWGLDIGYLLYRGYCSRGEGMARSYINEYEPTIDTLMRVLEGIYREGHENAVTLWPVPDNKGLAVMLTHDVDFGKSQENSPVYAELEKSQGVRATYFWQTKYVRDHYDEMFFNTDALPYLRQVLAAGMEIGSHSVAHSYAFPEFPPGDGTEMYPTYRPYISTKRLCHNGTVLGELRVSKYLLEQQGGVPAVVSFRPGHLSNPAALPQAMQAAGYRFSSTLTANTALTHLPFQLTYSHELNGAVDVFEFPVTLEDELAPRMDQRLAAAVTLAKKISRYGGSFVLLIHPNLTDYKLKFQQDFVSQIKPWAWFGTVGEYGRWWAARNQVKVDVSSQGAERLVVLEVPEALSGLTLKVPAAWRLLQNEGGGSVSKIGDKVLLTDASGGIRLRFAVK